jgi:hypothetical protein
MWTARDFGITSFPRSPLRRTSVPDWISKLGTLTRIPSIKQTRLSPVSNNTWASANSTQFSMRVSYLLLCLGSERARRGGRRPMWSVRGSRARPNRQLG